MSHNKCTFLCTFAFNECSKKNRKMNLTHKQLFIFDLDGTLIDSVPDISIAVNKTLKHYNIPDFKESKIRTWVGNGAKKLMERAINAYDQELLAKLPFEEVMQEYFKNYKENLTINTYAYNGVKEALYFLKNQGVRLAIVTNKPYDFIAPVLDFIKIKSLFSLWVGADSLPFIKPSAEPLLYVCEKLNISTEKAVMIGDSKNDILAAKKAKITSIGLTYGYNYNEPISRYNPDIILDNLIDIQSYF